MLERLADELRVVFAFLPVAALLSARGCSRALRGALDPRRARARRVWRAVSPAVLDWEFNSIPTVPGAQLWQVVFPGWGSPNAAFSVACRRGWLAKAQWLDATFALAVRYQHDDNCGVFADACAHGHLTVAQWLAGRCAITVRDVRGRAPMRRACENGRLDIAQWLTATFGLTPNDIRDANDWILRYTCRGGHLATLQWLVAHFGIRSADVPSAVITEMLRNALNTEWADVADWLVSHFDHDIVYGFRAYTPQERRFIARFYEVPPQIGSAGQHPYV